MKNSRGRTVLVLITFLLAFPIAGWAQNLKVLVILSSNSGLYRTFSETLIQSLPASLELAVLEDPDRLAEKRLQADLIIAVGLKATQIAIVQARSAILAVMIPRMGYRELLSHVSRNKNDPPISAIYIDQPVSRILDFLRIAFPERRKIGLLYSTKTNEYMSLLKIESGRYGDTLAAQLVSSSIELFPDLERILADCDILLATPDSSIYNGNSIRNILLSSYRYAVPLIGMSQSYVKAGAVSAIFSSPEQLARQTGGVVNSYVRTGQLAEPQYPDDFTIAINEDVAHSLGIAVDAPEEIRKRLKIAKEGGR